MEKQQPATSERVNPAPLKAFQTDDWTAYFGAEVGGATLTADPSCAVHQNLLVSEQLKVLVHVVWEVAELTDIWRQALSELPLKAKKAAIINCYSLCTLLSNSTTSIPLLLAKILRLMKLIPVMLFCLDTDSLFPATNISVLPILTICSW